MFKLSSQCSLLIIAFSLIVVCNGQSNLKPDENYVNPRYQNQKDKLDELLNRYFEYGKFNGSVLVAKDDQVIYKKGYGYANMEWKTANEPDTKFRLASVTKQFTAMLIAQLASENKLAFDAPLTTYLPDYPKHNGDAITIHHLLTHSSGIPNYTSFPTYKDMMRKSMEPKDIVGTFADSTLLFTPGERFSYSNSGYVLLGIIIEKITGQSFEKVLKDRILTPLKMHNTGMDHYQSMLSKRASGYHKVAGEYENASFIDMSAAYTAGGMYSTVEDLYLWDQALYTSTLLPEEYKDSVFKAHIPAWGNYYGYGWNVSTMTIGNTKETVRSIDHDGVINGFSALVLRIPEHKSTILLLNNTGGAPLYEIGRAISAIIYNKSYDLPKNSIANTLLDKINNEGISKGVAHFNKVKADNNYYLDEHEINRISYDLLNTGRAAEALEVLKLGIAAYPNAFNLYDSFGEIHNKLGNKEEAIKAYKKSVHLNPKNTNGIIMLKELGVIINADSLYILKTDDSWTREIFTFPLHFAKEISFEGSEEAHFPKGWRDPKSHEFWSYVFAWNVKLTSEISEEIIEYNLQHYFDGLMNVVNKNKDLVLPKTIAKFKREASQRGVSKFEGTLNIFDAFVTQKDMKLHVRVEEHTCSDNNSIVFFKFSPKGFDNKIWMDLEKIKFNDNICER